MKKLLTQAQRIERKLKLHSEIMGKLVMQGMERNKASREALRRMQAHPRFKVCDDFFTAVELEGYSLPHG